MSETTETFLVAVHDNVFAAQKDIIAALKKASVDHGVTAYDIVAILHVLSQQTIEFIYEEGD